MKIEELAAKYSDSFPGYQLVDYYEAAFPIYAIQLQVLVQEKKPLPPLEEFVLKAIDAEQEDISDIAGLLGLEETVIQSAVNNLQRRSHIIFGRGQTNKVRFLLAPQGRAALMETLVKEPKITSMGIAQDALTGKLYQSRAFIKMNDVRQFEYHEIPIFLQVPRIENVDLRTLQKQNQEALSASRSLLLKQELVEVLKVEKYWTEYRLMRILQFVRQDGSLQVLVFDGSERSSAHETALIEMEQQQQRPLRAIAKQLIPLAIDEIPPVITSEIRLAARRKAEELPKLHEQLQQTKERQDANKDKLGSRLLEEREDAKLTNERYEQRIAELEEKIQELINASSTTEVLQMHEHRPKLFEAFNTAKKRVILISPWLNYQAVDYELKEAMRNALQRGIELIIGYGFGESKEQEEKFVDRFKKFMTSPKKSLGKFHIYRVGDVHSKVLICDSNFMIISSFNWLSFAGDPTRGSRVEDGMLTKDQMAIDQKTQEWLERFDKIAHQERNGTQAAKV